MKWRQVNAHGSIQWGWSFAAGRQQHMDAAHREAATVWEWEGEGGGGESEGVDMGDLPASSISNL